MSKAGCSSLSMAKTDSSVGVATISEHSYARIKCSSVRTSWMRVCKTLEALRSSCIGNWETRYSFLFLLRNQQAAHDGGQPAMHNHNGNAKHNRMHLNRLNPST
mmetsp:Transcript_11290/g.20740  ORF Transcript_11290/g.20740 Transcript_11290/m.20740 type:complete len:104 (+) Transcript_11290:265-576(+)